MIKKHKYKIGGKVRTFIIDLNTMCEFDQITGMNSLHDNIWQKPSFGTIRAMAYCALHRADKAIKLEQVGEWVGISGTGGLLTFLLEAYIDYNPEVKKGEVGDEDKKKATH